MSINQQMGQREWIWLLALSSLWGASYFFTSVAVKELPIFTIVAFRLLLATILLSAIAYFLGHRIPKGKAVWKSFFVMGFIDQVVPFCLTAWGLTQIAGGVASVLSATIPFFTLVAAHLLTQDEKLSRMKILSVLLGFIGVAIMIGPSKFQNGTSSIWGYLAILGAAIFYALSTIYGRRFNTMGVTPIMAATGQAAFGALMLVPVALVIDHPWALPVPSNPVIAALLATVILSTVLANLLYFRILASAGATNLSLATFLSPVSAILLGVLILGERLEPKHIAGMALIAAGLIVIDGRLFRKRS